MRVLFIATNRHHRLMSRMEARPLPIGLAYVAGYLDPDRHTIKILDLMFSDDYLAEVESTVKEFRPDLVGISIRNLSNSSYLDFQWGIAHHQRGDSKGQGHDPSHYRMRWAGV